MKKLIVALLALAPPALASPQDDVVKLQADLLAGHVAVLSIYLLPENHTPGMPISADDVRATPAQTCSVKVSRDVARSFASALGTSDFRYGDYPMPTHTVIQFLDSGGKTVAQIGLSSSWNQPNYDAPVYIATINGAGLAAVNGSLPKWVAARYDGWGCERHAGYMFRY